MADKTLGDLIFDLVVDDKQFQSAIETSISTIKGLESAVAKMADSSIANFKRMASEAETLSKALAKIQAPVVGAAPTAAAVQPVQAAPAGMENRKVFMSSLNNYAKLIAAEKKLKDDAAKEDARREAAERQKFMGRLRGYAIMLRGELAEKKKVEAEKRKEDKKTADAAAAELKKQEAARKKADADALKAIKDRADAQSSVFATLGSAGSDVASTIMSAFKVATAAVATVGTAITVLGAKFESTINTVSVLSGGALPELTKAARQFGVESKFSAQEAADAMLNFAQAGMSAEENIAATGSAIKLAAASGSDLSLSTSIMSDAMSQFSLTSKDAANLADIFTFALNDSKLGMNDLSVSMRYAGTVGAGFGM